MPSRPAAQEARTDAAGGGASRRQIIAVMVGLMTGVFIGALDQTVVSSR